MEDEVRYQVLVGDKVLNFKTEQEARAYFNSLASRHKLLIRQVMSRKGEARYRRAYYEAEILADRTEKVNLVRA